MITHHIDRFFTASAARRGIAFRGGTAVYGDATAYILTATVYPTG